MRVLLEDVGLVGDAGGGGLIVDAIALKMSEATLGVLQCFDLYLVEDYGSYRLDGLPCVEVFISVGYVDHTLLRA